MVLKRRPFLMYLALSPLAYALFSHLHHVLLPFNTLQKNECGNPNSILQTYSAPGFNILLDRIVCVLVRFCTEAVNNPMSFPITATLVGMATTSYAIMSVERARFNGCKLLGSIMIMFGNVIGTGIIAPMAWLPIYGWTLHSFQSSKSSKRVNQNTRVLPFVGSHISFGIALATFFGQFLPVAILVSYGPSITQRNILAAFQYFPIVYALFEILAPYFVRHLNGKTEGGTADSVRLLYVYIASINAFISYWVWIKWLHTTNEPLLMIEQWFQLFFSFGTNCENPVTYMLMWDVVALFSTFSYWAYLEDGIKGLTTVISHSFLFGPGAGLALWAMKRESRI